MKLGPSVRALGLVIGSLMILPTHAQQFEKARTGSGGPPRVAIAAEPPPVSQLIVKYRVDASGGATALSAEASAARSHARAAAVSSRVGVSLRFSRAMSGKADVVALPTKMSVAEAEALAAQIANDPSVEFAEPDYLMRALASAPNDFRWGDQWSLSGVYSGSAYPSVTVHPDADVNVLSAWDGSRGTGAVVGVVDSGVTAHPDLLTSR